MASKIFINIFLLLLLSRSLSKRGVPRSIFVVNLRREWRIIYVIGLDENLCTKLSRKDVPTRDALSCFVDRKMYFPAYVPLVDPAYHRKD